MRSTSKCQLTDAELQFLAGPLDRLSRNGNRVVIEDASTIRRDVHRLALRSASRPSVVVKRMWSVRSRLEQRVTGRWLPAAGLDGLGPPRLAAIGDPDGQHTWHVYDDLGPQGLDRPDPDTASLAAAMEKLAELHIAFSNNAILPEARYAAGDMGVSFYVNSVRDALRSVNMLRVPAVEMSPEEEAVRDGVLDLLARLVDDEPDRLLMLQNQAGPETLVHGDLTRRNVFVMRDHEEPLVKLIDWDHCGVAPAGFDISTHLAYYEPPIREFMLESYTAAMAERGFRFPDDLDWELLVSTFEAGRLSNQVIWVALGVQEGNGWSFADLSAWHDKLAVLLEGKKTVAAHQEKT